MTKPDFSKDLHEWMIRLNGGSSYGARIKAAEALAVNPTTLSGWLAGRPCVLEPSIRKLMGLISYHSSVSANAES